MNTINNSFYGLETKALNRISHCPFTAPLAGSIRLVMGAAQIALGSIAAIFGMVSGNEKVAYYGKHYFKHGSTNIIRSVFEILPVFMLMPVLYDLELEARVKYETYEANQQKGKRLSIFFDPEKGLPYLPEESCKA